MKLEVNWNYGSKVNYMAEFRATESVQSAPSMESIPTVEQGDDRALSGPAEVEDVGATLQNLPQGKDQIVTGVDPTIEWSGETMECADFDELIDPDPICEGRKTSWAMFEILQHIVLPANVAEVVNECSFSTDCFVYSKLTEFYDYVNKHCRKFCHRFDARKEKVILKEMYNEEHISELMVYLRTCKPRLLSLYVTSPTLRSICEPDVQRLERLELSGQDNAQCQKSEEENPEIVTAIYLAVGDPICEPNKDPGITKYVVYRIRPRYASREYQHMDEELIRLVFQRIQEEVESLRMFVTYDNEENVGKLRTAFGIDVSGITLDVSDIALTCWDMVGTVLPVTQAFYACRSFASVGGERLSLHLIYTCARMYFANYADSDMFHLQDCVARECTGGVYEYRIINMIRTFPALVLRIIAVLGAEFGIVFGEYPDLGQYSKVPTRDHFSIGPTQRPVTVFFDNRLFLPTMRVKLMWLALPERCGGIVLNEPQNLEMLGINCDQISEDGKKRAGRIVDPIQIHIAGQLRAGPVKDSVLSHLSADHSCRQDPVYIIKRGMQWLLRPDVRLRIGDYGLDEIGRRQTANIVESLQSMSQVTEDSVLPSRSRKRSPPRSLSLRDVIPPPSSEVDEDVASQSSETRAEVHVPVDTRKLLEHLESVLDPNCPREAEVSRVHDTSYMVKEKLTNTCVGDDFLSKKSTDESVEHEMGEPTSCVWHPPVGEPSPSAVSSQTGSFTPSGEWPTCEAIDSQVEETFSPTLSQRERIADECLAATLLKQYKEDERHYQAEKLARQKIVAEDPANVALAELQKLSESVGDEPAVVMSAEKSEGEISTSPSEKDVGGIEESPDSTGLAEADEARNLEVKGESPSRPKTPAPRRVEDRPECCSPTFRRRLECSPKSTPTLKSTRRKIILVPNQNNSATAYVNTEGGPIRVPSRDVLPSEGSQSVAETCPEAESVSEQGDVSTVSEPVVASTTAQSVTGDSNMSRMRRCVSILPRTSRFQANITKVQWYLRKMEKMKRRHEESVLTCERRRKRRKRREQGEENVSSDTDSQTSDAQISDVGSHDSHESDDDGKGSAHKTGHVTRVRRSGKLMSDKVERDSENREPKTPDVPQDPDQKSQGVKELVSERLYIRTCACTMSDREPYVAFVNANSVDVYYFSGSDGNDVARVPANVMVPVLWGNQTGAAVQKPQGDGSATTGGPPGYEGHERVQGVPQQMCVPRMVQPNQGVTWYENGMGGYQSVAPQSVLYPVQPNMCQGPLPPIQSLQPPASLYSVTPQTYPCVPSYSVAASLPVHSNVPQQVYGIQQQMPEPATMIQHVSSGTRMEVNNVVMGQDPAKYPLLVKGSPGWITHYAELVYRSAEGVFDLLPPDQAASYQFAGFALDDYILPAEVPLSLSTLWTLARAIASATCHQEHMEMCIRTALVIVLAARYPCVRADKVLWYSARLATRYQQCKQKEVTSIFTMTLNRMLDVNWFVVEDKYLGYDSISMEAEGSSSLMMPDGKRLVSCISDGHRANDFQSLMAIVKPEIAAIWKTAKRSDVPQEKSCSALTTAGTCAEAQQPITEETSEASSEAQQVQPQQPDDDTEKESVQSSSSEYSSDSQASTVVSTTGEVSQAEAVNTTGSSIEQSMEVDEQVNRATEEHEGEPIVTLGDNEEEDQQSEQMTEEQQEERSESSGSTRDVFLRGPDVDYSDVRVTVRSEVHRVPPRNSTQSETTAKKQVASGDVRTTEYYQGGYDQIYSQTKPVSAWLRKPVPIQKYNKKDDQGGYLKPYREVGTTRGAVPASELLDDQVHLLSECDKVEPANRPILFGHMPAVEQSVESIPQNFGRAAACERRKKMRENAEVIIEQYELPRTERELATLPVHSDFAINKRALEGLAKNIKHWIDTYIIKDTQAQFRELSRRVRGRTLLQRVRDTEQFNDGIKRGVMLRFLNLFGRAMLYVRYASIKDVREHGGGDSEVEKLLRAAENPTKEEPMQLFGYDPRVLDYLTVILPDVEYWYSLAARVDPNNGETNMAFRLNIEFHPCIGLFKFGQEHVTCDMTTVAVMAHFCENRWSLTGKEMEKCLESFAVTSQWFVSSAARSFPSHIQNLSQFAADRRNHKLNPRDLKRGIVLQKLAPTFQITRPTAESKAGREALEFHSARLPKSMEERDIQYQKYVGTDRQQSGGEMRLNRLDPYAIVNQSFIASDQGCEVHSIMQGAIIRYLQNLGLNILANVVGAIPGEEIEVVWDYFQKWPKWGRPHRDASNLAHQIQLEDRVLGDLVITDLMLRLVEVDVDYARSLVTFHRSMAIHQFETENPEERPKRIICFNSVENIMGMSYGQLLESGYLCLERNQVGVRLTFNSYKYLAFVERMVAAEPKSIGADQSVQVVSPEVYVSRIRQCQQEYWQKANRSRKVYE